MINEGCAKINYSTLSEKSDTLSDASVSGISEIHLL
jgi:hypothetical protein